MSPVSPLQVPEVGAEAQAVATPAPAEPRLPKAVHRPTRICQVLNSMAFCCLSLAACSLALDTPTGFWPLLQTAVAAKEPSPAAPAPHRGSRGPAAGMRRHGEAATALQRSKVPPSSEVWSCSYVVDRSIQAKCEISCKDVLYDEAPRSIFDILTQPTQARRLHKKLRVSPEIKARLDPMSPHHWF